MRRRRSCDRRSARKQRAGGLAALLLVLATLPAATSGAASANPIDEALGEIDSGKLRFEFAARPGVYGDGHSITINTRRDDDEDDFGPFDPGPVRVVLSVRDGRVTRVRHRVGGGRHAVPRNTVDLGEVPVDESAAFLMQLAENARDAVAEDAIAAGALADVELWPRLLAVARQRDRSAEVRKKATFWVGQAASQNALGDLDNMAMDEDDDLEVREAAVFAISQRDEDESVATLIRIARSDAHPRIRKSALFWLSQVDDPRVLEFFEKLLSDR